MTAESPSVALSRKKAGFTGTSSTFAYIMNMKKRKKRKKQLQLFSFFGGVKSRLRKIANPKTIADQEKSQGNLKTSHLWRPLSTREIPLDPIYAHVA